MKIATEDDLREAVAQSKSFANVCRLLDRKPATGSQSHIAKRMRGYGIDTSHFTGQGWNKGNVSPRRRMAVDTLTLRTPKSARNKSRHLVSALLEIGRIYECEGCSNPGVYNGRP